MPDKSWKQFERRTARRLAGERSSLPGKHSPDFETPIFLGENKLRAKFPKWLTLTFKKIAGIAESRGKIPLVCLKEKRKRTVYYILREKDFIELLGGGSGNE